MYAYVHRDFWDINRNDNNHWVWVWLFWCLIHKPLLCHRVKRWLGRILITYVIWSEMDEFRQLFTSGNAHANGRAHDKRTYVYAYRYVYYHVMYIIYYVYGVQGNNSGGRVICIIGHGFSCK